MLPFFFMSFTLIFLYKYANFMSNFPILAPGDRVHIIAPASKAPISVVKQLYDLLCSWRLKPLLNEHLFGDDLLCANTDEQRFHQLKEALLDDSCKGIVCVRGGYGSMRLIPSMTKLERPSVSKLFIGMSDVTALNLFLSQNWHWPVLHGSLNQSQFSEISIEKTKAIILGKQKKMEFQGVPLNQIAQKNNIVEALVTGGNLCLVQTSIATSWQVDAKNKILFLEEIGERGYKVDRMLAHLQQAHILRDVKAIILGDFIKGDEPDGSSLISQVLKRFAESIDIPVIKIAGVGHDKVNYPLPLGMKAKLRLGSKPILSMTL